MTARQRGLNCTPRERYLYSNTGYIVLGLVVQRATGKSLREFAAERIFGPLGMTESHYHDDHTELDRGRAAAYAPRRDGGYTISVWNNDLVGQGGVMTTVLDLAKWDENFHTGKVGGRAFLERQLQRGKLNSGTTLSYAFGLQIGTYRGLPLVEHTGSTGGYRAVITRFPAQHTSVVALCNVTDAGAATLTHRVADVLLRDKFTVAGAAGRGGGAPATDSAAPGRGSGRAAGASAPAVSPGIVARFAGRYYSDELDATYEVMVHGTGVTLRRPRGVVDSLAVRDSLVLAGRVGTLRFTLGPDSRAASFVLTSGRVENIRFVRR
jgi:CubicO group peptidase (beta-lactamase class C family)